MKKQKNKTVEVLGYTIVIEWMPNGNVYSYPKRKRFTETLPYEQATHKLNATTATVIKDATFLIKMYMKESRRGN